MSCSRKQLEGRRKNTSGVFGFVPKLLASHDNLVLVRFVANDYLPIPLTDSCQIFSQVWDQEFSAKKLVDQFLPRFSMAILGMNQTYHSCLGTSGHLGTKTSSPPKLRINIQQK